MESGRTTGPAMAEEARAAMGGSREYWAAWEMVRFMVSVK